MLFRFAHGIRLPHGCLGMKPSTMRHRLKKLGIARNRT